MSGIRKSAFNSQNQVQELIYENEELKAKLMEANTTIEALKRENTALAKRLGAFTSSRPVTGDSTFITNGGDLNITCENCGKEVPRSNFDTHSSFCSLHISRCPGCNQPFNSRDLEIHMEEAKGTVADAVKDALNGDINSLDNRHFHGFDFDISPYEESQNSLVHIAVQSGQKETLHYLLEKGLSLKTQNKFGETPLHIATRNKDIKMVQFLVSKGCDCNVANALGESPLSLSQRNGFHEATLAFNSVQRPSTSNRSGRLNTSMGRRPNNQGFNL